MQDADSGAAPERAEPEQARAARELAQLRLLVAQARAELARLRRDIGDAEARLGSSEAAQLLEANEHLVLATLHAQREAQTVAQAFVEVSRSAELDALTDLPNRNLLLDRFAQARAHARRHGLRMALLFLDIDGFKQINDSLGHAVGDTALKRVAHCLASSVRQADTASRQGGDEFVVLLSEVSQRADAALVAQKVIAALAEPRALGDQQRGLQVSIGISVYPDDGEDAQTLLDHADAAMYRAKRQGRGHYVFHSDAPAPGEQQEPPSHGE